MRSFVPASSGESTSVSSETGANVRSAPLREAPSSAVAYFQSADGSRSEGASMTVV